MQCKYPTTNLNQSSICSEVWERAEKAIKLDLAAQAADSSIERWIASSALITHLRDGLKNCPYETKIKIIYGFEQVLPQVAYA